MVYYRATGDIMNKVKITVLKTTLDKELAEEYGAAGLDKCPMHTEGQVFYADYSLFYYGDWIRKPGVAVCSCNDGLRPVIFKLESTDEKSEINYTPVR